MMQFVAPVISIEAVEFFFSADEFDGAVVEKDAAAFGVVVVERKQLRPAVLVPSWFGLK